MAGWSHPELTGPPPAAGSRARQVEIGFAVPVVALVVYLFYTWFAVRDRYEIFLYFHDMGAGFDTSPFGRVTASRYWMAGLVAGGGVMVLYLTANLVLGRLVAGYRAPRWGRLWLFSALPLLVAIPAIVMTVNDPVLPPGNAGLVTAVTLLAVALALSLGRIAAERPLALILLLADGLALACLLASLINLERWPRWLAQGSGRFITLNLALLGAGLVLLLLLSALTIWWRRVEVPGAPLLFVAGLAVTYLFLPLYHHLFWGKDAGSWTDPDYFSYISDADNFFARSPTLQIAVWVAVAAVVWAVTRLRVWGRRRLAA